ncbi:MAG: helix-hairpin-helix domain-containing protein [Bryobacterales bacterium]|nr:helix-hairpin-helix domain-containing protein [Bryobacterales bacterium]
MRLAFLSSTSLLLFSFAASAQVLPEGPGKAETERLCKGCHELARSVSLRQDRGGWEITMKKMVAMGIKGNEQEFNLVLEYLVKNYPAEDVPPLHINKATAIEIESRLSLRRSQASAIIKYRNENGNFKTIDDLKKVPGIDLDKIEAKKDRVVF